MRVRVRIAVAVLGALALPATAWGHAERPAFFPDPADGEVPQYRTTGPAHVVCKPDSRAAIAAAIEDPAVEADNLALYDAGCDFEHIQEAVNAATNGDRILILPGTYLEEPSRAVTEPTAECETMTTGGATIPGTGESLPGGEETPTYEFHHTCPNVQNLIAIMGDGDPQPDPEASPADTDTGDPRWCEVKCDIQIEGTGDTRDDVLIQGDKHKLNVIRADRADGIYLKNFTVEFSDFNNIYAFETNGFRFDDINARFSREYGFLSFTSDNGLYENLEASYAGDSGIYPGSGPDRSGEPCNRDDPDNYGIEIRNVNSHHNTIGWSGTAGDRVYTHDSQFHHNSTGITMDSFASGHPGMPQDCSKWENNRIYSNNWDLYNDERDDYCRDVDYPDRDQFIVCPTFPVPEGTGLLTAGGNLNTIENNLFYDNWRQGAMLVSIPAVAREEAPVNQFDNSWGNQTTTNLMGVNPTGAEDPNGVDFWWDEQNGMESAVPPVPGVLNCWQENIGFGGRQPTSDPPTLPACTGERTFRPPNPVKEAQLAPCAAWDPEDEATDSSLPGCDWFENPIEPQPRAAQNGGGGGTTDPGGTGDEDDEDSGGGGGDGGGGQGGGGSGGSGGEGSSGGDVQETSGGSLPFTGLSLVLVLIAGVALATTGIFLRRGAGP